MKQPSQTLNHEHVSRGAMRRLCVFSLIGLMSLGMLTNAAAQQTQHQQQTPQEILKASDAIRNPDYAFGLINTLSEYRQGKQTDASSLMIYSKVDPKTGQYRSLVRYLAPARDQNKLILYNGRDLWFFDPASRNSIRLSPQQRLIGQASNGDVVTANLAKDYQAISAKEESTQDGDRQKRDALLLELNGKTDEASYRKIELWVDQRNYRPIKARFYSESGKLMKTAYYRRYQNVLGAERPTEVVIIDGLEPDWLTVMRYSDWQKREVPENWLQRDYLPRFNAE